MIRAAVQLAGLGGVVYGLWLVYEPVAWIFGGVAVVLAGVGTRRGSPPKR